MFVLVGDDATSASELGRIGFVPPPFPAPHQQLHRETLPS